MSLVNWSELPVRIKRSRKRLYSVLAEEFGLSSWIGLDVNVKRSKVHLYSYIASELGLVGFDELPVECRRSTRLLYLFIRENASSPDTLTVTVTDGSNPVSEAIVTIGEVTVGTGADGKASFSLEYGDYTCTVACTGYEDTTETLSFRSNHKNFSITLIEGSIRVSLSNGSLSEQAIVEITGESMQNPYRGVLDNGSSVFTDVPNGEYFVHIIDEIYEGLRRYRLEFHTREPVLTVTDGVGEYVVQTCELTVTRSDGNDSRFNEKDFEPTFILLSNNIEFQTVTGIIPYGTYTNTDITGDIIIDTPTKTITIE